MNTLFISYDLRKPDRNYGPLIEAIKANPSWAKLSESAWLIQTAQNATYWRDSLRKHIDANDVLAVFTISSYGDWATCGVSPQVNQWIHQNLK